MHALEDYFVFAHLSTHTNNISLPLTCLSFLISPFSTLINLTGYQRWHAQCTRDDLTRYYVKYTASKIHDSRCWLGTSRDGYFDSTRERAAREPISIWETKRRKNIWEWWRCLVYAEGKFIVILTTSRGNDSFAPRSAFVLLSNVIYREERVGENAKSHETGAGRLESWVLPDRILQENRKFRLLTHHLVNLYIANCTFTVFFIFY